MYSLPYNSVADLHGFPIPLDKLPLYLLMAHASRSQEDRSLSVCTQPGPCGHYSFLPPSDPEPDLQTSPHSHLHSLEIIKRKRNKSVYACLILRASTTDLTYLAGFDSTWCMWGVQRCRSGSTSGTLRFCCGPAALSNKIENQSLRYHWWGCSERPARTCSRKNTTCSHFYLFHVTNVFIILV